MSILIEKAFVRSCALHAQVAPPNERPRAHERFLAFIPFCSLHTVLDNKTLWKHTQNSVWNLKQTSSSNGAHLNLTETRADLMKKKIRKKNIFVKSRPVVIAIIKFCDRHQGAAAANKTCTARIFAVTHTYSHTLKDRFHHTKKNRQQTQIWWQNNKMCQYLT